MNEPKSSWASTPEEEKALWNLVVAESTSPPEKPVDPALLKKHLLFLKKSDSIVEMPSLHQYTKMKENEALPPEQRKSLPYVFAAINPNDYMENEYVLAGKLMRAALPHLWLTSESGFLYRLALNALMNKALGWLPIRKREKILSIEDMGIDKFLLSQVPQSVGKELMVPHVEPKWVTRWVPFKTSWLFPLKLGLVAGHTELRFILTTCKYTGESVPQLHGKECYHLSVLPCRYGHLFPWETTEIQKAFCMKPPIAHLESMMGVPGAAEPIHFVWEMM